MPAFMKLTDVDGEPASDVPNLHEIVVTKDTDSAHATPFYLKLEGVDGDIAGSRPQCKVQDFSIVKTLDDTTFDGFVWGLDRVDQSAPATFFDGRFLRGVDLAAGADDPDGFDDVIVGTGVQGHVKSIDIDATAPRHDVNDMYIFQSPTNSTSPSFGGSGDDILIGGATSYDAIYKMHLIGHTTAGSTAADGNTYLGMTTVVDGGINLLLCDGSVRDISPRDAAFFAYDQGFLGGVTVAAGDIGGGLDAIVFTGDLYDPLHEQAIGGISIAVADIEGKGPHMLMTAGFMF